MKAYMGTQWHSVNDTGFRVLPESFQSDLAVLVIYCYTQHSLVGPRGIDTAPTACPGSFRLKAQLDGFLYCGLGSGIYRQGYLSSIR